MIVEPVAANMNLVAPAPGLPRGAARRRATPAGALLIFDEVITGFRLGPGGATGWSGVTPDLWCFGKVIGGGLPVGAFGGRRDLMAELAPGGPVYQAGTLSGNPLATAAGLAVLERGRRRPTTRRCTARVAVFAKDLESAVAGGGLAVVVPDGRPAGRALRGARRATDRSSPPTDYEGARALGAATGVYGRFFHAMLRRGVALAPGPYEVMFPGLAHDDAVLARCGRGGRRGGGRGRPAAAGLRDRDRWRAPGWPEDFDALRRGEGCPMCAPGRRRDAVRRAGLRGPVGRRVPRALPGATRVRVRRLEGPARGRADRAVRRGAAGFWAEVGARGGSGRRAVPAGQDELAAAWATACRTCTSTSCPDRSTTPGPVGRSRARPSTGRPRRPCPRRGCAEEAAALRAALGT